MPTRCRHQRRLEPAHSSAARRARKARSSAESLTAYRASCSLRADCRHWGSCVLVTGVIDARENETAQAWPEVIGGAALMVIGWVRERRSRR